MPTLGIRQSTWQGLRPNQRALMRGAFVKLSLGTSPALYETPAAVPWFIFDDWRLDELMFARLGTLANEVAGVPVGWRPPTIIITDPETGEPIDTGIIDRQAVEDEAIARVQASIVCPKDIVYDEFDPNRYDTTLKANSAPGSMLGAEALPESMTPVEQAA